MERRGVVVAPLTVDAGDAVSDGVTYPGMALIGYFPEGKPGDRLRFTIAHELGHLVLHRHRRPIDAALMEREANEFAGEFLFPETDARAVLAPGMTLEDYRYVKSGWGISIAASVRRAFDLGVIDHDKYTSLYVRMSQRRWTKREPVGVKAERPVLLSQMLGRAFGGLDDDGHATVPRTGGRRVPRRAPRTRERLVRRRTGGEDRGLDGPGLIRTFVGIYRNTDGGGGIVFFTGDMRCIHGMPN
ncbi:ImmA/IrrE family metallo-endopeptidase [Bifidobacterium pseudocatenulatum]|uniref:ImmA/IrrE family metallo-endopeptidase n=1 Tax=Bifidobacterium pseudocatenulatum TaxID=28026 RepID=UPI0022E75D2C|nr:ImmA/IrrE family metallo-endopeptidase [Bifidobacterium pseudocatenulatum]